MVCIKASNVSNDSNDSNDFSIVRIVVVVVISYQPLKPTVTLIFRPSYVIN